MDRKLTKHEATLIMSAAIKSCMNGYLARTGKILELNEEGIKKVMLSANNRLDEIEPNKWEVMFSNYDFIEDKQGTIDFQVIEKLKRE